jgi:hypothetical protein
MSLSLNYPVISPSLLLDFANTKSLDPRVTFTRASTATYYDGKTTVKAEENMLLYSENFELADWARTGVTITANANTAPDGTSTADLMVPNATDFSKFILQDTQIANGGVYTQSVFVKAGGYNFAQLTPSTRFPLVDYVNFNLSTGAIGNSSGTLNPTITSVGNGWYRISITATANSTGAGRFLIAAINADTNSRVPAFIGDGTSGILIWGAQLEQRSSVTPYTATTTQPITNYIPVLQTATANTARFDHNPITGESLGLEIEEQRTNLITYSDDFANAAWTKTRSSVSANTIVAPDGTLTGDTLIADTAASTTHFATQSASFTSGVSYTVTLYAKQAGLRYVRLGFSATAFGVIQVAFFDLQDGVVTSTSGTVTTSIQNVGNGWWRVRVTATATATASDTVAINLSSNGTSSNFTGDGYSGIYIWGAQLEAGAFATSYIPTVASQVTRSADAASMTGSNFSSWFRQDEGTLYNEATPSHVGTQYVSIIGDGSTSTLGIGFFTENSRLEARVRASGGGSTIGNGLVIPANTPFKAALYYSPTNNAWAYNGTMRTVINTSVVPTNSADFRIGANPLGTINFTGTLKKLAYYPARLTDTQLQALTT